MTPRSGLILALLALAACPKKDASPEAPPATEPAVEADPAPDKPEPTPEELETEMTLHFGMAVTALSAVIEGDLDGARASHAELRDMDASATPEPWRPLMADVKAAAAKGAEAESLADAARALGAVGQACGDCHTATNGGPKLVGSPPHHEWDPNSEMMRHQWAASLMWLGLTAPSPEAWKAGADALSTDPLAPDVQVNDTDIAKYGQIEKAVHAAATAARDTEDRDDAAQQYAEIVSLCATCHALVKAEAPAGE